MTDTIDEVFVGDSYAAIFSWTKPTAANPNVDEDANPTAATFTVVRSRNGQAVALEDNTADVSGNETTARIPAGTLTHTGEYRLYLTATFADETTLTRSRPFRVLAKDGMN